jgi:hypothetical protein
MNWLTALVRHDSASEEQPQCLPCCDWDHIISHNRQPRSLPTGRVSAKESKIPSPESHHPAAFVYMGRVWIAGALKSGLLPFAK